MEMELKDDLRRCFTSQCDFCREGCASYLAFNLDSYSSRGKNRILEAYQDGRLELSDLIDLAFKCTVCGQCSEVCMTGDGIYNKILDLRAELVRQGLFPNKLKVLSKKIMEKGTAFDEKSVEWALERGGKGNIGYFPGCGILAFNPDLALKTLDVLEGFGMSAVPITSQCCSSPLLKTGFSEQAIKVAERLHKELKEKRIRTLICSCPGCALTLKEEYPALVTGWKIKVLHISEFLVRKRPESVGRGEKIIYHDPCHLARGLNITAEPRKILEKLGYEVMEFNRNGRQSLCCGGGGGVALLWPDESNLVSELKVEEALDAGAELLVTFCPLCENKLGETALNRIEVRDVVELL